MLSLGLTGCVSIPERVEIPQKPDDCGDAVSCKLAVSTAYAQATEKSMLSYLRDQRNYRDALRVTTLVGAIATAGATSFGAGRDLTVALGLGTGTVAVTSALTSDRGYAQTYLAAADAAACIAQASGTVKISSTTVYESTLALQKARATLNQLDEKRLSPGDSTDRAIALAKADNALSSVAQFGIAGTAFAARSQIAVDDVVVKARTQIAAQEPDRAAFAEAIGMVGALAVAPPVKSTSTDKSGPGKSGTGGSEEAAGFVGATEVETSPADKFILTHAQDDIDRSTKTIEDAITQVTTDGAAKLTTCGGFQTVAAAQPLTISGAPNDTVTMSKDMNVSLSLSGGDVGYRGTWIGTVPKDLTLSQQGNAIDITAGGTLEADKAYTLRIRDLATKSQSKDISVKTK
jgi:hypothetical protein